MVLTVLAVWTCLAVPAAAFVAAVGRSALLQDQALGHLPRPGETQPCVSDPARVTPQREARSRS
jgi:hypothetical protein